MPSELFEKKLREKLSQATIPPSPELWNNIESRVSGNDSKKGYGFWILLLALLLGSAGMLWGFWNYTSGNDQEHKLAEVQLENPAPALSPISELEKATEKDLVADVNSENSPAKISEEKVNELATHSAASKSSSKTKTSPPP